MYMATFTFFNLNMFCKKFFEVLSPTFVFSLSGGPQFWTIDSQEYVGNLGNILNDEKCAIEGNHYNSVNFFIKDASLNNDFRSII